LKPSLPLALTALLICALCSVKISAQQQTQATPTKKHRINKPPKEADAFAPLTIAFKEVGSVSQGRDQNAVKKYVSELRQKGYRISDLREAYWPTGKLKAFRVHAEQSGKASKTTSADLTAVDVTLKYPEPQPGTASARLSGGKPKPH
jgi:hypothetical protein